MSARMADANTKAALIELLFAMLRADTTQANALKELRQAFTLAKASAVDALVAEPMAVEELAPALLYIKLGESKVVRRRDERWRATVILAIESLDPERAYHNEVTVHKASLRSPRLLIDAEQAMMRRRRLLEAGFGPIGNNVA